jgi:hypothetical protein
MNQAELDALESMIDTHGMHALAQGIAYVCWEKADHARSNWQDEPLAKRWEKLADIFDRVPRLFPD